MVKNPGKAEGESEMRRVNSHALPCIATVVVPDLITMLLLFIYGIVMLNKCIKTRLLPYRSHLQSSPVLSQGSFRLTAVSDQQEHLGLNRGSAISSHIDYLDRCILYLYS